MSESEIVIRLSQAEALVPFEWLSRLDSSDSPAWKEAAEERVLWRVQGQLESVLVEPFQPNYKELVAEARRSVCSDDT